MNKPEKEEWHRHLHCLWLWEPCSLWGDHLLPWRMQRWHMWVVLEPWRRGFEVSDRPGGQSHLSASPLERPLPHSAPHYLIVWIGYRGWSLPVLSCKGGKGKRFSSKRTHQSPENETQIQGGELPSTSSFFCSSCYFSLPFFHPISNDPYTVLIILWPQLKVLPWFLSNLRWDILCRDLGHTMNVLEKLFWPGLGRTSPPWWASPPRSYPGACRQHPLLSS